ncbi:hypothetical protein [Streptomyces acidicola]|uniref:hypothetical protein n=1 Tax=Streptomyces acidicola TaxID=2596892 RepID=UPI00341952D8
MSPWQWTAVVLSGLGLFFLVAVPISALVESVRHMVRRRRGPRVLPSAPGTVQPAPRGAPAQQRPKYALLCPHRYTADLLTSRGIPDRCGVIVVSDIQRVPADVPVIVLHDAEGCLLAGRTREALPGRLVVDAGLSPHTVMKATGLKGVKAVPRADPPSTDVLRLLRDGGTLTDAELDWLARGDRFPLAAMPPAKLPAAVTRVIERITVDVERERRRRDEAVGFLTWPDTTGVAP